MAGRTTSSATQPGVAATLFWAAVLIGLPMAVAWRETDVPREPIYGASALRPPSPPPAVEPMELVALDRDQARAFNAAIPFSTDSNPAARPFRFAGSSSALDRAVDCLAAAELYEAGDDPVGERAVAQVVLNRLRHPAFPKTVCGVVFQGSERSSGCQFTFTCDGALARVPEPEAWERARKLAAKALKGSVFPRVGYATHYHTDWVVPYWSGSLDKIAAVETHLFFRWAGWWGTPPAFRRTVDSDEPAIPLLSRLSPAHAENGTLVLMSGSSGAKTIASAPLRPFTRDSVGKTFAGARLVALEPGEQDANGFILALDRRLPPDGYPTLADTFCGGRQTCRILAWTDPAKPPERFPVDPALLATMTFSYIHDAKTGLQRSLWNCRVHPRASPQDCMRDRESGVDAIAGASPPVVAPYSPPPVVRPPAFPLSEKSDKRAVIKPPETSPAARP